MKKFAVALALAFGMFAASQVMAQDCGYGYGYGVQPPQNRLFQNQYTQAGASQYNAALYIAPQPVPSRVGHTYYTYEALYPHEHLYQHRRRYFNYYAGPEAFYGDPCKRRPTGGGAVNRTTVIWQAGCQHYGNFPFSLTTLQRAQYNLFRKKYCLGASCSGTGKHRHAHGYGAGGCSGGNCGSSYNY